MISLQHFEHFMVRQYLNENAEQLEHSSIAFCLLFAVKLVFYCLYSNCMHVPNSEFTIITNWVQIKSQQHFQKQLHNQIRRICCTTILDSWFDEIFYQESWQEHKIKRTSCVFQSLHDKMSQELVAARTLRDQRFGGVVFTVGGAEVLMGQWEPDVALFY